MKKVFAYIGIVLILAGVFTPIQHVLAETGMCTIVGKPDFPVSDKATCDNQGGLFVGAPGLATPQIGYCSNTIDVEGSSTVTVTPSTSTECAKSGGTFSTTNPEKSSTSDSCSTFAILSGLKCWFTWGLAQIGYLLLQFTGLLLAMAGMLLNAVLKLTVVDMAQNINKMVGIGIASKVIRDLMNIMFIFILVYYGIKMIIGKETTATIRKFIVGIVMASLLLNFSIFFTKIIIDASNIATIGFYNSILGGDASAADANTGLSNAYMGSLNLTNLFDPKTSTSFADVKGSMAGGDDTNMLIIGIGASVLFLITAFVFLAVSVMFLVRYLLLILLLMTSAIGFIGAALPFGFIKKYADQWWDVLLGQCLFGPVYMLMTWIVITLMTNDGFISVAKAGAPTGFGQVLTNPNPSSIGLLLNFFLVIGLAIASLTVAKSLSTKSAKQIGDFSGKATALAGGAVFGGGAAAMRNTLGRAGNSIANSERLKDTAANGNIFTRNLSKFALKTGDKTAKSTFDARSTEFMKSAAKTSGIDVGKGADVKKVSFQKNLEAQSKKQEDLAKMLKPTDIAQEENKAKAKAKLADPSFIAEENQRRKEHFNSAEYIEKNGIEDAQLSSIKENFDNANKKREEKKKKRSELQTKFDQLPDGPEKNSVLNELTDLNEILRTEETNFNIIKDQYNTNKGKIEKIENKWLSDKKKEIIALQGGQDEKKEKGVITQEAVESLYQKRVGAMATRIEESNTAVRWAKVLAGTTLSPIFRIQPQTKQDKKFIASKVRAVAKAKKPKEEFEDLLKKAGITTPEAEEETPAPAATVTPPANPTI